MLDIGEIDREIDNLEHGRTTYTACEKLALLYIVRDHLSEVEKHVNAYSYATAPSEKSEFIKTIEGAEPQALFKVLDEHMQAVQALYPREYAAVLKRIRAIKGE